MLGGVKIPPEKKVTFPNINLSLARREREKKEGKIFNIPQRKKAGGIPPARIGSQIGKNG